MPPWSILAPRPDPADFSGDPVHPYTRTVRTVSDSPPHLHPLIFTPIDLSVPFPESSLCSPIINYPCAVQILRPFPHSIQANSATYAVASTAATSSSTPVEVSHKSSNPSQVSPSVPSEQGLKGFPVPICKPYTDSSSSLASLPVLRKLPISDAVRKGGVQHTQKQIRPLPKVPVAAVTSSSVSNNYPIRDSDSMRSSVLETETSRLPRPCVSADRSYSFTPAPLRPLPTPGCWTPTSSGHPTESSTSSKNPHAHLRDRRPVRKLPTPPTQYAAR